MTLLKMGPPPLSFDVKVNHSNDRKEVQNQNKTDPLIRIQGIEIRLIISPQTLLKFTTLNNNWTLNQIQVKQIT